MSNVSHVSGSPDEAMEGEIVSAGRRIHPGWTPSEDDTAFVMTGDPG